MQTRHRPHVLLNEGGSSRTLLPHLTGVKRTGRPYLHFSPLMLWRQEFVDPDGVPSRHVRDTVRDHDLLHSEESSSESSLEDAMSESAPSM